MIRPLADDFTVITASPDPEKVFCYTPGILRLPDGALLATMDYGGPGVREAFHGAPYFERQQPMSYLTRANLGRAFLSYDDGASWQHTCDFGLCHARPFMAGGSVYILGHHGDIGILRSDDCGKTWGLVCDLTHGQMWNQSACNGWVS